MPDNIILDGDVTVTGQLNAPNSSSTGDGGLGPGGGKPGAGLSEPLPETQPNDPPEKRAADAGFNIDRKVEINSIAEVDGQSNTLYIHNGSNGPLKHNGKHAIGDVTDVVVAGENDSRLKIPGGYRDFSVTVSGGNGFMWTGVSLDQRANGAWGRMNINVAGRGFLEYFQSYGAGRRANPNPNAALGKTSGATISLPATNSSGTNRMKNVTLVHGGVMASKHYGDREMGVWYGNKHKGRLSLVNCRLEEFPNNAVYASNTNGAVTADNCRFYNNAVSQFRAANGYVKNSTLGFDFRKSGLGNADANGHGLVGIMAEQKAGDGALSLVSGNKIEMLNVANCGGGITGTAANSRGRINKIVNNTIDMGNTGAPAINPRSGSFGTVSGNTTV